MEDTIPSVSVELNDAVTVVPVSTGLGVMLLIVAVGGRSFTVSEVEEDPVPMLLVAATVIVKV